MKKLGRRLLWIYLILTVCFVLTLGALLLRDGPAAFYAIQTPSSSSTPAMNAVAFSASWLFIGLVTCLSQFPEFARRHAAFLLVFVLIGFAYLNIAREPHTARYGDFLHPFLAAVDMRQHQPIAQQPGRVYLYPPLLASLLAPFVSLGIYRLDLLWQVLNYSAVLLLMLLLYLALQQYRFSRELAALALFGIMAANVPVARTLHFHQLNLHVANLVLLSLLLFDKYPFWSAFSLSLAIHLKVYPVVLVLPYLYRREWRWCAWFAAAQGGIFMATSLLSSPRYYLEFFGHVSAIRETALRNVSIDSLLYNTLRMFELRPWVGEKSTAHVLRLLLALGVMKPWYQLVQRGLFVEASGSKRVILNSYVILPVLMLGVSPSIWSHHFVLLILTMLVLGAVLRDAWEFWLFLYAYAFIFLFPNYDIYPVSYLRLFGLILLIVLLNGMTRRPTDAEPAWFYSLNRRLAPALAGIVKWLSPLPALPHHPDDTRSRINE